MVYKPVKQYTNHALMDEIVYNTEVIVSDLVVKNQKLADEYETQEIVDNAEVYYLCMNDRITFNLFPFTKEYFVNYGITDDYIIKAYLNDRYNIPEEIREGLLLASKRKFINDYVEKNNYYRALNGIPTVEFYDETCIYIPNPETTREYWLPRDYTGIVDYSIPLHEQPDEIISLLNKNGVIDNLIDKYKGNGIKYMYLRHLGYKKIDVLTARRAERWEILYINNNVENLILDRFCDIYEDNREIFLKRTYQECFSFDSYYYDEICIIMLIAQTFNDMVVDTPEWYIRRDIFDIRSVQYFLDAYGVKYFKQIPLKYQIRIVKNLCKLIKYKSTDYNFLDIIDLFDVDGTKIYKYYLFKNYGTITPAYNQNQPINLEFIQTLMGDSYDDYIKNSNSRVSYDEITYDDQYWDGEDTHDTIRELLLQKDFSIERTKYYSIDYEVNMGEYEFQTTYFLNLLASANIDNDITIPVSSIDNSVKFKLLDLFVLISCFNLSFYNMDTTITKPDFFANKIPKEDILNDEPYMNWLKKWVPELYYDMLYDDKVCVDRIVAFNMNADLAWIQKILDRINGLTSNSIREKYTLESLGIDKFRSRLNQPITSFDELFEIYHTNRECYEAMQERIIHATQNMDEYRLYTFIFNYLFTVPYTYLREFEFTNGTELKYTDEVEYLKDKNYILYNYYQQIASIPILENRQDAIRLALDQIIDTLEYYLKNHRIDYVLSNTAISGFFDTVVYIKYLLDFFKSYKVQFLDPYNTYIIDNHYSPDGGADNQYHRAKDVILELEIQDHYRDKHFIKDVPAYTEVERTFREDPPYHDMIYEKMDIIAHFEPNPFDDYDYNGMDPENGESSEYKMADGGLEDHTDTNVYPYFTLDAGHPQLLTKNFWDMNGSGPVEMLEYFDLDGGHAYDPEDTVPQRTSYYIKEDYEAGRYNPEALKFSYIVDGGTPSNNTFISRTIITRVIDRSIESEVLISDKQYNQIKLADDGLYIQQQWASWSDFNEWREDADNTLVRSAETVENLNNLLEIISDEQALQKRVEDMTEGVLHGMKVSVENMNNDSFENMMIGNVNGKLSIIENSFNHFNPFDWLDY